MRPLHDKVLVERAKKEENKAKILLINEPKQKNEFTVLAIGKDSTLDIKIGDKILVAEYGTVEVPNTQNKEIYIVNQKDILMVIE